MATPRTPGSRQRHFGGRRDAPALRRVPPELGAKCKDLAAEVRNKLAAMSSRSVDQHQAPAVDSRTLGTLVADADFLRKSSWNDYSDFPESSKKPHPGDSQRDGAQRRKKSPAANKERPAGGQVSERKHCGRHGRVADEIDHSASKKKGENVSTDSKKVTEDQFVRALAEVLRKGGPDEDTSEANGRKRTRSTQRNFDSSESEIKSWQPTLKPLPEVQQNLEKEDADTKIGTSKTRLHSSESCKSSTDKLNMISSKSTPHRSSKILGKKPKGGGLTDSDNSPVTGKRGPSSSPDNIKREMSTHTLLRGALKKVEDDHTGYVSEQKTTSRPSKEDNKEGKISVVSSKVISRRRLNSANRWPSGRKITSRSTRYTPDDGTENNTEDEYQSCNTPIITPRSSKRSLHQGDKLKKRSDSNMQDGFDTRSSMSSAVSNKPEQAHSHTNILFNPSRYRPKKRVSEISKYRSKKPRSPKKGKKKVKAFSTSGEFCELGSRQPKPLSESASESLSVNRQKNSASSKTRVAQFLSTSKTLSLSARNASKMEQYPFVKHAVEVTRSFSAAEREKPPRRRSANRSASDVLLHTKTSTSEITASSKVGLSKYTTKRTCNGKQAGSRDAHFLAKGSAKLRAESTGRGSSSDMNRKKPADKNKLDIKSNCSFITTGNKESSLSVTHDASSRSQHILERSWPFRLAYSVTQQLWGTVSSGSKTKTNQEQRPGEVNVDTGCKVGGELENP